MATSILFDGCTGYEIRNDKLYYISWNEARGKIIDYIDSADINTFEELGHSDYARDKYHVYYQGRKLKKVDPKSFVVLSEFYGHDNKYAYNEEKIINGAYGKSFKPINNGPYSTDGMDYYYDTIELKVNNYKSFVIITDDNDLWAKDMKSYYIYGHKSPLKDYFTFQKLNETYAKDKFQVYCCDTVINVADPITFKVTGFYKGEDKNYTFDGFKYQHK